MFIPCTKSSGVTTRKYPGLDRVNDVEDHAVNVLNLCSLLKRPKEKMEANIRML